MRKGVKRPFSGETADPEALIHWANRFLEHRRVRHYSERTLLTTECALRQFAEWANDRGLVRPADIGKDAVELYQRWLYYLRTTRGQPLTVASQRVRLQKLKGFFRWLQMAQVIQTNPAAQLELPRPERRIPRAVFNEQEVERVLTQPDPCQVLGLRDRAMMEVLYSTGIRRQEMARLELADIDAGRETLTVRLGKGKKDRVVPIGERALGWVRTYLAESRSKLIGQTDSTALFLNEHGRRLAPEYLTNLLRGYVDMAKLGKTGACHIFRHTMATLMLEGGADVRHIQEMLGHAETSTTAIYTRVSIRHLKKVHDATHPGARTQLLTIAVWRGNSVKFTGETRAEGGEVHR